ncbi:MAG TPA: putative zinc-binding metallopeptidase [Rhizobacter sp.]|nr:putative zinc-binding metallopeptidase [Rhizobacter sp.]
MNKPRELLFESIAHRLDKSDPASPTLGRNYRCVCKRPIFFRNSQCLACKRPLGYEPHHAWLLPLQAGPVAGTWQAIGENGAGQPVYRRCANFDSAAGCNWLVGTQDGDPAEQVRCMACRLNRMIPDQSIERNRHRWRQIEVAKRRLVSALLLLGLPVKSRHEDPQHGLCFDLLSPTPTAPRVLTGHENGLITLNVEEADDAIREKTRAAMHEPYRTLLGHFRHEVGHYYWERLVDQTQWLPEFRRIFGDEQQDYAQALKRHYQSGAPADWALHHVSAYASSHPWEDWAETWAHYLHMMDTMDTTLGFGIDMNAAEQNNEMFTAAALYKPDDEGAENFLRFINAWVGVSGMMNELARSMGQSDLYPFVLPAEAVGKLQFIQLVVMQARDQGAALEVPAPVGTPAAAPPESAGESVAAASGRQVPQAAEAGRLRAEETVSQAPGSA